MHHQALLLVPAVLGHVEHDAVDVLELPFGVDAGVAGQLHELTAVTLDPVLGRALVLDDESEVMQPRPVGAAPATFGSFGEMQQREVHVAVRQRDGVADRRLDLLQALQAEGAFMAAAFSRSGT